MTRGVGTSSGSSTTGMLLPANTSAAATAESRDRKRRSPPTTMGWESRPAADGLVGDGLAEPANVGQGVALADDRPPAAGAEHDGGVGVLPGHEQSLEHDVLGQPKLVGAVDALDLVGVVDLVAVHPAAARDDAPGEVGEPVLPGRGHCGELAEEQVGAGHVAAHVHLGDGVLGVGAIGVLRDGRRSGRRRGPPGRRTGRRFQHCGEQGQVRALEAVAGEQAQQGLGTQQRGVAVGDQHLLDVGEQEAQPQQRGGPGPVRLGLLCVGEVTPEQRPDLTIPASHDDHDPLGVDHRPDVGHCRLHDGRVPQRASQELPGRRVRAGGQHHRGADPEPVAGTWLWHGHLIVVTGPHRSREAVGGHPLRGRISPRV